MGRATGGGWQWVGLQVVGGSGWDYRWLSSSGWDYRLVRYRWMSSSGWGHRSVGYRWMSSSSGWGTGG